MNLIQRIASDETLEQSLEWLCQRRRKYSHNDDVWEVRYRWAKIKPTLQADLMAGRYRFSPLRRVRWFEEQIDIWCALDSLVLKAMALVLTQRLRHELSSECYHLVGRGGAKAALRNVLSKLLENRFVFRTDVKRYYASIDHTILFSQLQHRIHDERLLHLLWLYMRRTVYDGGRYHDIETGIPLGCSLSPLMGALYLDPLDRRMKLTGLFYARFMDDWVVLAPSRWKLRAAIKRVNQTLTELKVEQHPDKTFIGRISRGFEFLGYRILLGQLGVARKTTERVVLRMTQLYE